MHPEHASCPPTIQSALEAFVDERRRTLGVEEHRTHQRVVFFLALCINNYGHRNLNADERARFERVFRAHGPDQRHFFEVFGPDKLLQELDFFAHSYVKTDVFTSDCIEDAAPAVADELAAWLVERGYVSAQQLEDARAEARARAALKARAGRAARLIRKRAVAVDPSFFRDEDYIAFDDHAITRVEAGRFWLRVYRSAEPETIGPFVAPVAATRSLVPGWTISCALARVQGRWRIAAVDEVYPRRVERADAAVCAGGATDYNLRPVFGEPTKATK